MKLVNTCYFLIRVYQISRISDHWNRVKQLSLDVIKFRGASDSNVGQIQRYMGYVKDELSEQGQTVTGIIIALEDNLRIKRALSVANNIGFYRYEVRFNLFKD